MKDRSLLVPDDALYHGTRARRASAASLTAPPTTTAAARRKRTNNRSRSRTVRSKGTWKKLLWVKQSYPDNYTDQETFLEHLQRNPRLQPYDFWPLVADSTVIVQHVCSVIIFVVCFVGIFQEHLSPIAVVGGGSIATFAGWLLWDAWVGREELPPPPAVPSLIFTHSASAPSLISPSPQRQSLAHPRVAASTDIATSAPSEPTQSRRHAYAASTSSVNTCASSPPHLALASGTPTLDHPTQAFSHRTALRLSTAKSALLIYFTLLGLSPILKSLTRSTSSDSIWAISFLLFTINIFFFDYSTPPLAPSGAAAAAHKNFPASLSTNAALMASTVLASRLPSTGQVFSLTLFSIEAFGLFPVFRRYLRQRSWRGHVALTTVLVLGAGGGVGLILGRGGDGEGFWDFPYKSGCIGLVLGVFLSAIAMGGCSWWLIGLQKYKNEIHGPWDPARPIIRRSWTDDY
ncbi:hypothetical protein K3495_g1263 [Podosphaera aphanis]|nr:hypothetical protein K3495_g1263 [Podosphaera aphanis]